VAKLRENLRAEHNVTIEFCAAVFKGVLNSFQMASLLVQVRTVFILNFTPFVVGTRCSGQFSQDVQHQTVLSITHGLQF
jgi:hypothetical protein